MKWIVNPMDEFVINCTRQTCIHYKCPQNQCNPPESYCTENTCSEGFDNTGGPCDWECVKGCTAYCPDHICSPPESYTECYTNQVCPAGWETPCPTYETCPTWYI